MARVTMQTIADRVGVSKFAVSRAFAGKSGVSERTRRRILKAGEELGYLSTPSVGIRRGEIALIFDDSDTVNSELWLNIQRGAQIEAARSGFSTTLHWNHDRMDFAAIAGETAGIILVGNYDPRGSEAAACGVPVVRVGWVSAFEPFDQVVAADAEAGEVVGRYLTDLGHRTVAYVHGEAGRRGRLERLRGFREALAAVPGTTVAEIAFHEDERVTLRDAFVRLVESGIRPTALFCGNDGVAVTAVTVLLGLGLKVPQDISVVGFADYACAEQIHPKLTTVRMPGAQIGAAAVRTLLDRCRSGFDPEDHLPRRILLLPAFVERKSAGPVTRRPWPKLTVAAARPAKSERVGTRELV